MSGPARANGDPNMLTRLIYASESTAVFTPDSVQSIVDHARAANGRRQLTGMLLFDRNCFLQALEGHGDAVSEAFCRIAPDPRHRRVVLLDVPPVDERLFGDWTMGFAAVDARGRDMFLRFGGSDQFNPHAMTAASALGLLRALAAG